MAELTMADHERVTTHLRQLVAGAEELLAALRKDGGERYDEATERIRRDIGRAREALDDLQYTAAARARVVARRTDRIVRAHPWQTAGAAATLAVLLGVAIGLLVGRSLGERPL
jgi:ElaB/YqjD/DUF883 family membrane-anchored ribosome-binding protein